MPDDDHRPPGVLEHGSETVLAVSDLCQRLRTGTEMIVSKVRSTGAPIRPTFKPPHPALSDTRVKQRRFPARVGTHNQDCISLFNSRNRRIEEVPGPCRRIERRTVLATIEVDVNRARSSGL